VSSAIYAVFENRSLFDSVCLTELKRGDLAIIACDVNSGVVTETRLSYPQRQNIHNPKRCTFPCFSVFLEDTFKQ